jgi:hypothetical protein
MVLDSLFLPTGRFGQMIMEPIFHRQPDIDDGFGEAKYLGQVLIFGRGKGIVFPGQVLTTGTAFSPTARF